MEEIGDAEELDEVESLDEVEEIGDAEELDEVESLDEVEEIGDAEELDEVESLDEVEEIGDAEELDEVESLDEVEEIGDAEELDEVESLDEVEEIGDAEELDEVESLDEVAEAKDADAAEALSETESLDEVEDVAETEEAPAAEPAPVSVDTSDMFDDDDGLPPAALLKDLHDDHEVTLDDFIQAPSATEVQKEDAAFEEKLEFDEVKPHPSFAYSNENQYAISFSVQNMDFSQLDEELAASAEETVAEPYQKKADDMVARLQQQLAQETAVSHGGLLERAIEIKREIESPQQAIVEQEDGVYVIPKNLHTEGVKQNADFKSLVDSVLNND